MERLLTFSLLMTIFAFLWTGCEDDTVHTSKTTEIYCTEPIQILTFEGCEYVKFSCGSGTWGAHKGNCKNPIHKQ